MEEIEGFENSRKQQIIRKWDYVKDLSAAFNFVSYNLDFALFGGKGAGKSEFVRDICSLNGTDPVIIDCIEYCTPCKLISRIGEVFHLVLSLARYVSHSLERMVKSLNSENRTIVSMHDKKNDFSKVCK